jgi:phage baseplate assembly protein V
MGDDFSKYERRIKALEANRGAILRWATVTGVDEGAGTARVQIADGENMVSMPLRVMQRRTLKDQHQELPDVGEHVACLFAGQGFEQGVVLGAVYSEKDPCPGHEPQVAYHRFEDGTELQYDRKAHKLTGTIKGDVDVTIEGELTVKVNGAIVLESATSILAKAPRIALAGKLTVTDVSGGAGYSEIHGNTRVLDGGLKADKDVMAGSVSLLDHEHEGVEAGRDVSSKPVGGGGGGWSGDSSGSGSGGGAGGGV